MFLFRHKSTVHPKLQDIDVHEARRRQTAGALLKAGHSAVNVAGGMQAWTQAGLPVGR